MLITKALNKPHSKSSAKIRLFVLPKYIPQKTLKGIAESNVLKAPPALTINQAGTLNKNSHKKTKKAR